MKKIISIILMLAMLLTSSMVFADDYSAIKEIEISGERFSIKGQNISAKDTVITFQVLKDGVSWTDVANFDHESGDIIEYLAHFDAVDGVAYGEDYSFTAKLYDGGIPAFRIRFGDSEITYYDPALMESINGAETAEEMKQIIIANAAVWDELSQIVEALTDEEEQAFWQILLDTKNTLASASKSFNLPSDVVAYSSGVVTLAQLVSAGSPTNLEDVFKKFHDDGVMDSISYDIYAGEGSFAEYGMSDSQKDSFLRYISGNVDKYEFVEDFLSDFNENAVLFAAKDGSKYFIREILASSDLIDPDEIPTYTDLSSSKKISVCEKIGVAKRYTSIDEMLKAVESLAKNEKKNAGSSDGGGGGGGGGASYNPKDDFFMAVGEEDEEEKAKTEVLPFNDIANALWAHKAITALADAGIINGNGYGQFNPNNYVTRDEFIKMLVLTLGISSDNAYANFDDITSSDWSYPYVCAAVNKGVVNGITEATFGKGRIITREEMATMTHRAIVAMGVNLVEKNTGDFSDSALISSWAIDSCRAMYRAGIINGMGNNNFAPSEYVTRAQAAKILYEVMNGQEGI